MMHCNCLYQVVALYDYKAQRSDELTIFSGDNILLLHKDSDNWWMGELQDGQQGFFPANYVTMAGGYEVLPCPGDHSHLQQQ